MCSAKRHVRFTPESGRLTGVNKPIRRRLGLRANQLRPLETCDATVPSHVGGSRPNRRLKHRHSNDSADDENVTG